MTYYAMTVASTTTKAPLYALVFSDSKDDEFLDIVPQREMPEETKESILTSYRPLYRPAAHSAEELQEMFFYNRTVLVESLGTYDDRASALRAAQPGEDNRRSG